MSSIFLVLPLLMLAYGVLGQSPYCWNPTTPDECGRTNFPDYEVLYGMFVHCLPVPAGEPCHINTQDTIQCQNLSLSRSPIIPGDGEGFKLSTLTTDELCDALVPKVLGVTFEYAGCAWGDPIDQKETILFDRVSGWIDVKTSYYHSIACSFEGAASDPYPES